MNIAILGPGRYGRRLGYAWAAAGHTIHFGSRQPVARRPTVADDIPDAHVLSIADAIESSPVVVLAVPYTAVRALAQQHAAHLLPRIVVDLTNPFDHLPDNRVAGAEITANSIGPGARVVAAFKTNFLPTLLEPIDPLDGLVRDVLMAGDDEAAKHILAGLIEDLGFRPVDCGPLRAARVLDSMVPLMLALDARHAGGARRISWKMLG